MSSIDYYIIACYFLSILFIGIFVGRKDKDTRSFFIGNRRIPGFAVLLSIIATEISAATFLAVPGTGFNENLNYIQFGLGSIVARFFVAYIFISAFYKYDCTTVYEYLAKRFGEDTRYTGVIFFFATRMLGCGARLFIAAAGLQVITGWSMETTIFLFALIAIVYTAFGGIKAVVWTDVLQAFIFIGGGFAAIFYIWSQLPDGASQALTVAQDGYWLPNVNLSMGTLGFYDLVRIPEHANHLQVFHWMPVVNDQIPAWRAWLNDPNIFLLAFINSFVTTWASMGTDQDMTQRMLTCKSVKTSQRALIWSGLIGIPVAILFLFIGISIYAYFQSFPDPFIISKWTGSSTVVGHDTIFAYFIKNILPNGLRGFLIVGLIAAAMSSLDSALGALTSAAIVDIYKPLISPKATEKHYLLISRCNIVAFGVILGGIAWLLRTQNDFLWLCLTLTSITYGSLLGIFLLGTLSKRGTNKGNIIAMISGALLNITFFVLIRVYKFPLGWSWLILIGTAWTYCIGYIIDVIVKLIAELKE